ncbi:MAG: hypothetical protein QMD92_01000 [bacterium]|nr:hypothetical protein [bacterium]
MSLISKIIVIIILILPSYTFAAFEDKIPGGRPQGLGGAFCALANDNNAIYYNPAGLVKLISPTLSSTYQTLFNLPELRDQSLNFALPLKNHKVVAFAMQVFGKNVYKERCLFLSYATSLFKSSYLGINIKSLKLNIIEAGLASSWSVDVGFLYDVNKNISLGMMAKNINKPFLGEKLHSQCRVGVKVNLIPKIELLCDFDYNQRLHIGVELGLNQNFILRQGFLTKPKRYTFGLGIKNKRIALDYALANHSALSFTNQVSLTIIF